MKVLFLFGTRPEAIKLIPIILGMKKDEFFDVKICVTAQHREMLDQVLKIFGITPDFDLNLMTPNQTLATLTSKIIVELDGIIKKIEPDYCVVQGDTTSVMAGALSSFYNKVKVIHVEAGLRTFDKYSPFPEEMNRVLTSHLSNIHFTPTQAAKENLLKENVEEGRIYTTGNTVVDTLLLVKSKIESKEIQTENLLVNELLDRGNKFILVTSHRRENFGQGIKSICLALKRFAEKYPNVEIVFPVHLNPNIQAPVYEILKDSENVFLLPPLDYVSFVALLSNCYFVLTDSGGVQEEAPSLGKPVLVMRETTERPEAVIAGLSKIVGTDEEGIVNNLILLMEDTETYRKMANGQNPYGDGKASERIFSYLKSIS